MLMYQSYRGMILPRGYRFPATLVMVNHGAESVRHILQILHHKMFNVCTLHGVQSNFSLWNSLRSFIIVKVV